MNHLQKIEKLGINTAEFDAPSFIPIEGVNDINPRAYIEQKVKQLAEIGVQVRPVYGTREERDQLYALESKFKTLALQLDKKTSYCKTVDKWADLLTDLHQKHIAQNENTDLDLESEIFPSLVKHFRTPLSFDEHVAIGTILKKHVQDYHAILDILEGLRQSSEINLIHNEILRLITKLQVRLCNQDADGVHTLSEVEACYWDTTD